MTSARAALKLGVFSFFLMVASEARAAGPWVDRAITLNAPLETFLKQKKDERADLASGYANLSKIVDGGAGKGKSR